VKWLTGPLLATILVLGSCSSDDTAQDRPQANIANEPPYGPGAVVDEVYEYDLYTHCGIEWARIDGVWWQTDLLDDGNRNPPDGWDNPFDTGQLVILDHDTAEYKGGPGVTVRFTRTEASAPPFECE
jgi:hypothetical protein